MVETARPAERRAWAADRSAAMESVVLEAGESTVKIRDNRRCALLREQATKAMIGREKQAEDERGIESSVASLGG